MIKKYFKKIIPVYNEIFIFLVSVSFLLLFLSSEEFRLDIFTILDKKGGGELLCLIIFLGIFFSFFHVFSKRKKFIFEKKLLAFFIVFIIAFNSANILQNKWSNSILDFKIIFPMINLIYIIVILVSVNHYFESMISDEETNIRIIKWSSFFLFVIFLFLNFASNSHYTIIFSICITYAELFSLKTVNRFL